MPRNPPACAFAAVTPDSAELAALYARWGRVLERRVRAAVRAPHAVIEDACQIAWSQLLGRRTRIRTDAVFAWLATTARREAIRLLAREGREASLEHELEQWGEGPVDHGAPSPQELLELRERLVSSGWISPRQRRLVWLHAFGLDYHEIARYEGCTRRAVERQLLRGKRGLLRAAA